MPSEINMITVAMPFPNTGGGGYRALLSIKEYKTRGINNFLVLPWSIKFQFTPQEELSLLRDLLKEGLRVYGKSVLPRVFSYNFPLRRSLAVCTSTFLSLIEVEIDKNVLSKSHCVMSMHETIDAIATCHRIGEVFSLKRIALLQLPPFYGDSKRIKNIEESSYLWLKTLEDFRTRAFWGINREIDRGISKHLRRLLSNFELILAVSKSIPMEMGEDWAKKVIALDPGVGLSLEDLSLITSIVKRRRGKERVVVFGGRPSPEKGLIEALMAFREVRKSCGQDLKLAITGRISGENLKKIVAFCDRLGIKDNVIFYGFLPREDRLSIVAKSIAMLYPSHVDAFPYAVLESIYLNTPVIAYDIPALRIYYSGLEGVTLVRESDLDALAQKTIETIEKKNVRVEKPKILKKWEEIMDQEVNLIKDIIKN
ncbi:MAG: glycosyltransferase [Desulfurococcaceae archaeon]